MAIKEYTIKAFKGIDQSKSENSLDAGASPDARNMDTMNGDLAVARGYVKHLTAPVPGAGPMRRLYIWRDLVTLRYIAIAGNEVYAYVDTDATPAWKRIHTFTVQSPAPYPAFTGLRWDFLEARIGNKDYLIIANGERQMIKWDGLTAAAELFGTSANLSDRPTNFIAMHYGRLFAAGDRDFPSRLYWSKPPGDTRSIEDWRMDTASENASGGFVEVGDTAKDPIVGLCALSNQLLVFKRDSIYRLLGDRPGNYRVYRVHAEVERMADSALVVYGDTPFWMTRAGMHYHDGQSSQPMYNARQIRNYLANARLTMCKATENRDRLYFTCRTDETQDIDNAIIVYDAIERTYMVRDGFTVADITAINGMLFMINEARFVYRFNEGETYDGAPIDAYWQTPMTDLENKMGIKLLRELYFRGLGEQQIIQIHARAGANIQQYRYMMPSELSEVLEIPLKNEGRVFSLRLLNEAGSSWRIEGGLQLLFELRQRTI